MSESRPEVQEIQPSQVVIHAFDDWLKAEIDNSYDNNNAVLNSHGIFEASLALPYEDPENVNASKIRNHFQRLELWTDEIFAKEDNDEILAHQLFGVLMGLSGAYREQCFIVGNGQDAYMGLRYGENPLGLEISAQVTRRLFNYFRKLPGADDLKQSVVTKEGLISETHRVNQFRDDAGRKLFAQKPLTNMRRAILANRQLELRKTWLDLGIDYVLYAAQLHDGDLSKIVFLEPKSINEAKLVSPLGGVPPYFVADSEKSA